MKTARPLLWMLLAAFSVLYACNTTITIGSPAPPAPFEKQPLTLSRADVLATIKHMQLLAKESVSDSDAAKKAEQVEHQAHLAADADAATSRAEAVKLGQVAATAAAQRDAEKKRADDLAVRLRAMYMALIYCAVGSLLAMYAAGATLETGLRALLAIVGHAILVGLSAGRLLLKTAMPTFFFWL